MEGLLNTYDVKKILDTSLAGIWLVDVFGRTLYTNERLHSMLGFTADDFTGKAITEFLRGGKQQADSLARTGTICDTSRDFSFRCNDGTCKTAIVSQSSLRDDNGQLLCNAYMLVDISKRKQMEETIRQRDSQLTLQNQRLTQKNFALKEMITQVAQQRSLVETNVLQNVHSLITPLIERLKESDSANQPLLQDLEQNIASITSSFSVQLQKIQRPLTSREWEICRMIRSGFTSKEIASLLKLSVKSIQNHRNTIRKKLNISNKKVNLTRYLNAL